MTPLPSSDSERRSSVSLLALLGLATLVALAYANSLSNGFIFDDEVIIVQNPLIKRVAHLPTLLTSDYWAGARDPGSASQISTGLYRPLVLLSYAANYAIGGLHPLGYHLVNVVLHLLVVWLVYLLAIGLDLSVEAAFIAAAIFAVHPIHTEVVLGTVGRAELLMSAGLLAGLRWGMQGRRGWSVAAFAFGLLSKEQAVMLPALLLLYDLCRREQLTPEHQKSWGIRWMAGRYGPYVMVLTGYLLVRWWALGTLRPPPTPFLDNPLPHLDWYPRLLTTITIAGDYLWLSLWPASLSIDYSFHAIPFVDSLLDRGVLFAVLAWGSLIGLAVWSFRRERRATFGVGFLSLTFLPASNLILPIGTIMGERLFYLPSVGLCLLLALGYARVIREGRRNHIISLVVLSLMGLALLARTIVRNTDWANTYRIAASAVQVVPQSAKIHSILGHAAKDKGQWDEAIGHFQTALSIYPGYEQIDVTLNSNLGISLIEKGQAAEGIEALERAVRLDPGWSLLHYNLGFAYARQGRDQEAEASYRKALALNDEDPRAPTGLGFLFLKMQRYAEALEAADMALRRDPNYLEALFVKARTLDALGRLGEAAETLQVILRLDPSREAIRQDLEALRARQTRSEPSSGPDRTPRRCLPGMMKC